MAARQGADINANPRLRLAVDKALSNNMTRDTVDRAIKRGAGGLEGENVEELVYEGYGSSGVAVLVDCLTDNRNRTVAEIRHAFAKSGGNLGAAGSVAYLFVKQGQITFSPGSNEDKIMEVALSCEAEDVIVCEDKSIDVITTPEKFTSTKQELENAGLKFEHDEITMNASTKVALDLSSAEKVLRMIDLLEDLDDVQAVYTNADVPDEIAEQLT